MGEASQDYWTIRAMQLRGGSFVQALGAAAQLADQTNLQLIKKTWPDYWAKYADMAEKVRAEEEAAE